MHPASDLSNTLVRYYHKLPLWGKILVGIGGAAFLALGLALNQPNGHPGDPAASAGDPTGLAIGVFVKLVLVVLCILGITIIAHRYLRGAGTGRKRRMKIVETLSLSPRRALHLVQVGDQTLLIGATDQSIGLISAVGVAETRSEPSSPQPDASSIPVQFEDLFAAAQSSLNAAQDQGAG